MVSSRCRLTVLIGIKQRARASLGYQLPQCSDRPRGCPATLLEKKRAVRLVSDLPGPNRTLDGTVTVPLTWEV